jgi:membrane protease YdiL (CAAX protease family)
LTSVVQAVVIGMVIVLAGTIPRNLVFAANLQVLRTIPWAVPVTAIYLWFFWRYLHGDWPGDETAALRRASLRAHALPPVVWAWALLAGIIEESAFRGYMQGPIERRYGLVVAILITGTMFAIAHLDFTWQLWPY